MKGLITLIKLSKQTLDELRRKMTALENQKVQLEQAIVNLRQEVDQEMASASQQPEMSRFFGGFAKRMKQRELDLRSEIGKVEKQMQVLAQEITLAFADLKKYEIAQENTKQRAREAAARRETEMMDEIAGQQFHRRQSNADE